MLTITDNQWSAIYKPMQNHIVPDASCSGEMFETYGPELEHVISVADSEPARVWTYLDGDDGEPIIVNGYWLVGRIGYFITEKPLEPEHDYCEVILEKD
jgi:hypothetical protein